MTTVAMMLFKLWLPMLCPICSHLRIHRPVIIHRRIAPLATLHRVTSVDSMVGIRAAVEQAETSNMKLSPRYKARLENYWQWSAGVTTPLSTSEASTKAIALPSIAAGGEITAGEWLFMYETHGKVLESCNDLPTLDAYWRGKTNRDYWFKEVGWLNKHSVCIPEEFLHFMHPLCFIELFGRAPITELVRFRYDNSYRLLDFRVDMWLKSHWPFGLVAFEREDRDAWWKVCWQVVRRHWNIISWRIMHDYQ